MSEKLQTHIAGIPTLKDQSLGSGSMVTLNLTAATLSLLAGLCEREAARLSIVAEQYAGQPGFEDVVADADNDGTYWRAVAKMLRDATL